MGVEVVTSCQQVVKSPYATMNHPDPPRWSESVRNAIPNRLWSPFSPIPPFPMCNTWRAYAYAYA